MKKYKKHIVIFLAVSAFVASGLTANALIHGSCNYNIYTGNYTVKDKTYAHGTMANVFECALYGVLPKVVADRLGVFGDEEAKKRAREILETNEDNQKKE